METIIATNEYAEYDKKSKVALNKLFIKIYRTKDGETVYGFVPLSELYVDDDGKTRQLKSYSEYEKFLKKNGTKIFSEPT
ncbi:MAG: hypothetical protein IJ415_00720, partial [Clostridia bacterium]|nr:hypothetical protein [Clostridia bacterium]